ncbi:hypothetical protein J6590_062840 [Homalodisca vitripennis]|nr:hypothetical protein J6590_062840 [Homalodisca vitripennis]
MFNKLSKCVSSEQATFKSVVCPQQNNSLDCDIYMLLFVDWLMRGIIENNISNLIINSSSLLHIHESDIIMKRSCLAYLWFNNQYLKFDCTTVKELLFKSWVRESLSVQSAANCLPPLRHNNNTDLLRMQHDNKSTTMEETCKGGVDEALPMRVEFYTDSHGRDLPEIIDTCSKGKIRINGLVIPGASTQEVYRQAARSGHHPVVIIAGTNDVTNKTTMNIYCNLEKDLKLLSKSKTILITTIPHRYDLELCDPLHDEICLVNSYIRELAVRMNRVVVIDLEELKRFHFTRHGLHLNYRGKRKLAYMLINSLSNAHLYPDGELPNNKTGDKDDPFKSMKE